MIGLIIVVNILTLKLSLKFTTWCKPKNLRVGTIINKNVMKSYRSFFIALLSFFCFTLNAQVFIGGNFGYNSATDKTDNGGTTINKTSNYNFSLSPNAGKFLSEKVAFGFALDITLSGSNSGVNPETISRSYSLGGSLFLRYYAIKWNKFSVFGQGNIGLAFANSSIKAGGSTTNGPKPTKLYFSVYPGLSYDINDKLSLQTTLNILSFGYTYITTKTGTYTENTSSFNIGAGLSKIVSIGDMTIGAIYKF
jgi:opacity protein-like surface antigen